MKHRCIVCGTEERPVLPGGRSSGDGRSFEYEPAAEPLRCSDGAIAAACSEHSDDEVVTASRLTELTRL